MYRGVVENAWEGQKLGGRSRRGEPSVHSVGLILYQKGEEGKRTGLDEPHTTVQL
jgi:hypothetical protein